MGIHVSLPKEMEEKVMETMETGMYGSVSEVIRDALRQFFTKEEKPLADDFTDEQFDKIFGPSIREYEAGLNPPWGTWDDLKAETSRIRESFIQHHEE